MNKTPPMTRVIQTSLEEKIRNGELAAGDRLYSLRDIANSHSVSIAVALSAVRALERKGLVVTEPGRGSFVKKQPKPTRENVRICSWNGVFPPNYLPMLLDHERNPAAPQSCEATPFFTAEYENYKEYLDFLKRTAANDPLDIAALDEGLLPSMAEMGLLAPLNQLCEKEGIDLNSFPAQVLKGMTFKGKLYGLPMAFSTCFLIYNKKLFSSESAPLPDASWGWNELYSCAEGMTRRSNDGGILRYGLGIVFNINAYAPFIFQAGGEIFDRSGSCSIGSANSQEALEFFSKLYSLPGVCSHKFGSPRSELANLLSNGLLAALIGDAEDYKVVKAAMPESDWGFCPLPSGKAGQATSLAIHGWGISSSSPNPAKALRSLRSFLDRRSIKAASKQSWGFPAYKPIENGTPAECIQMLDHAAISLQSSSPEAFKAFHSTITTSLNHKLILSSEKCLEFQAKINEML